MAQDTKPTATRAVRIRRFALMASLPLALALVGAGYWVLSGRSETTENANLHHSRLTIASDLGGRVTEVAVHESQRVEAGDLLFRVDPEPYKFALADAEAALAAARLAVEQLKAAYAQAQAQAKLAANEAAYLQQDLERQQELASKGVSTGTSLEDARHQAQRAAEMRDTAELAVAGALAVLGGDADAQTDEHRKVKAALVARDRAAYNLALTEVHAPADGIVYQATSFGEGQMVAPGQPLFALVETGSAWVDANFKETQLASIAVGQRAEVAFDLDRGQRYSGRVEAIGAGTGAEFSLLPAQNATGNWVKVSQRVPVRIALDDPAAVAALASGLSAKVVIDTTSAGSPP